MAYIIAERFFFMYNDDENNAYTKPCYK